MIFLLSIVAFEQKKKNSQKTPSFFSIEIIEKLRQIRERIRNTILSHRIKFEIACTNKKKLRQIEI